MYRFLLRYVPRPWLIRLSLIFKKGAKFYYGGKRYEDPISGETFRKFMPYGQNKLTWRENVLAPGTFSLERHRLMWLFLKNKTDFFTKPAKVLHMAPEQCFYKRFKAMPHLDYVTGDYNSPIADVHFDLHHAPFEDNTFDVVFCNHVLEHVADDAQCMRELFRIMKPGGWGIFQVPIDYNRAQTLEDPAYNTDELREQHYWQKDHVRLFGHDYKDRLAAAGFEVDESQYINSFSKADLDRYRLGEGELIYYCTKPK